MGGCGAGRRTHTVRSERRAAELQLQTGSALASRGTVHTDVGPAFTVSGLVSRVSEGVSRGVALDYEHYTYPVPPRTHTYPS